MPVDRGIETAGEFGLAVAQDDAVVLVDDVVAVGVLVNLDTRFQGLDGLRRQRRDVGIVLDDALETVTKESAERFTHLDNERIDIGEGADRTEVGQERLYALAQRGYLVGVVCQVEAQLPSEVATFDDGTLDIQFDTLVGDRTDVTQHGVEACHSLDGNVEEEVTGLLVVVIDRSVQAVVEETGIETHIERRGSLPLQVGVGHVLKDAGADTLAAQIVGAGHDVAGELIITDFLVADHAIRGTELEVVDILTQVDPLLAVDVPRTTQRGEEAPTMVFGKTAGTIGTESAREVVTLVERVVDTA